MSRSRAWCFTINNWTDADFDQMQALKYKYLLMGRELGANGTPHLQGYIYYENQRTLAQVKQHHATAHWEAAQGSVDQNWAYCTKDGDFSEFGTKPMSQKRKGEVGKEAEVARYARAWEHAKLGNYEEVDADIRFKCYRTLKEIRKDFMDKPADLTEIQNHWIYGAPGVGKSRSAREEFAGAYFKPLNKWWDGYQQEESVIIDDFELDTHLGHFLKIWGDRYSFIAEIKGGGIHIRPKHIIITSNYSIEECFGNDPQMCAAIKRRFNVRHMLGNPFAGIIGPSAIAPTFRPLVRQEELPAIFDDNSNLE